jgi:hypothetical protein
MHLFNRRFFISWIVSSIVMYALSYMWHGLILNDLAKISISKDYYLQLAGFAYLGIGFLIGILHGIFKWRKSNIRKGLLIGAPVGAFIYLVAYVFGISFYANPSLTYLLTDITWQSIEQGLGGAVYGMIFSFVAATERIFRNDVA